MTVSVIGAKPNSAPPDGALLRGEIDAAGFGEQRGGFVVVRFRPVRRLGDLRVDFADDIRVIPQKAAVDEEIAVLDVRLGIDGQRPRVLLQFGDGEERVPDRPSVN